MSSLKPWSLVATSMALPRLAGQSLCSAEKSKVGTDRACATQASACRWTSCGQWAEGHYWGCSQKLLGEPSSHVAVFVICGSGKPRSCPESQEALCDDLSLTTLLWDFTGLLSDGRSPEPGLGSRTWLRRPQAAWLSCLLGEDLCDWVGVDLGRFQSESECKCWFHLQTGLAGIGDGHCVGLFP